MPTKIPLFLCCATLAVAACGVETLTSGADSTIASPLSLSAGSDLNGHGIYVVEGGNYCIPTTQGLFCPHSFEPGGSGGVNIAGIISATGAATAAALTADVDGVPVVLDSIRADRSIPTARYTEKGGTSRALTGADLARMVLHFDVGGTALDMILVGPGGATSVGDIFETPIVVRAAGGAWNSLCRDDKGAPTLSAFVEDARFDPFTAKRTDSPGYVTFACRTGGIATCQDWGYKPGTTGLNGDTGEVESLSDTHAACIQMKRAAYCGTWSYTLPGTTFGMHDVFGIQDQIADGAAIEAVWTPSGAACVNSGNLRPVREVPSCIAKLPRCPAIYFNLGDIASAP